MLKKIKAFDLVLIKKGVERTDFFQGKKGVVVGVSDYDNMYKVEFLENIKILVKNSGSSKWYRDCHVNTFAHFHREELKLIKE